MRFGGSRFAAGEAISDIVAVERRSRVATLLNGGGTTLTGALLAATAMPLAAQTASDVAPPTRGELTPPQAREDRPDGPSLTIDGSMERTPCALDNPEFAGIETRLNEIRFVGAEKAPEVALGESYAEYLGRDLPISVLCDIRAQANQMLQRADYLATVEIPAQRIAGGVAEFRIVFGRVTALRVRGDAGPSEQLVASYLERLTEDPVFNTGRAERYLLLADDLPGVDVRLSLRPAAGGEPGDLIGEIAVLRRSASLDFNVQNYGSKALGRFGGLLRGEVYDLTGMGDRTSLALFSTLDFDEQQTIQLGHDFRVGRDGLTLGGNFTYSWTDPDVNLPGFDVQSETLLASINAAYPLLRSRQASMVAGAGFDYVDQDVEVNDLGLSRDRVRMLWARIDGVEFDSDSIVGVGGYSLYEPRWRVGAALELRQGIDIFHASPDCRPNLAGCTAGGFVPPSRIEADPTPLLARFEGAAEYRPVPRVKFQLGVEAQYSGDALPAFEEFAAGTYSIGRGYDPGSVLGDSGVGVSLEAAFGSLAPRTAMGLAVQPYAFTDAAWAWNEDPSRSPLNPDRLWSVGGGVRLAWGGTMQADLAVAVPLEKPDFQASRGDVRVLMSITTRLFPWRF